MDVIIKIAGTAVVASTLYILLKKDSPESAFLLTVAAGCTILCTTMKIIENVVPFLCTLSEMSGVSSAIPAIMLKTAGIAIISKYTSDLCRDAGQVSTATVVEFAGCITALYVTMPIMETVLDMINSFW